MAKYLKTVGAMEKYFFGFSVKKIPRDQSNMLAKAATHKLKNLYHQMCSTRSSSATQLIATKHQ
jgi:hypothetical protein